MLQQLQQFRARKSLGQNFLHDENIVRKIIEAIDPQQDDTIVEIGPGFGVLTGNLLESGCRYVGIEIDQRLISALREKFSAYQNFELYHADFCDFDLSNLASKPASLRLVGNIPYHITSSIVFKAFEVQHQLKDMVLMVQKEVGERIAAASGNKSYGILSVISQTYAKANILFTVSPNVFIPRPDVASAVVYWDFAKKKQPQPDDPVFFRNFIKRAFNQRRKILRNSLKTFGCPEEFVQTHSTVLAKRPENMEVEELIRLANTLRSYLPGKERENATR